MWSLAVAKSLTTLIRTSYNSSILIAISHHINRGYAAFRHRRRSGLVADLATTTGHWGRIQE
jgi:hypothetical protein